MMGPIALAHSNNDIHTLINNSFDRALQYNVAMGFHKDEGMFWGAKMVNVFAFGVREGGYFNILNDASEGPEAIRAYKNSRGKKN